MPYKNSTDINKTVISNHQNTYGMAEGDRKHSFVLLILCLILVFCSGCTSLDYFKSNYSSAIDGKDTSYSTPHVKTNNLAYAKTDLLGNYESTVPNNKDESNDYDIIGVIITVLFFIAVLVFILKRIRQIREDIDNDSSAARNNESANSSFGEQQEFRKKDSETTKNHEKATNNNTQDDSRRDEERKKKLIEYFKNTSMFLYLSLKPLPKNDQYNWKYMLFIYGDDRSKGCWELPLWSIDDLGCYLKMHMLEWGFEIIDEAEVAAFDLLFGKEMRMRRKKQQHEKASSSTQKTQAMRKSECLRILGLKGEWPSKDVVKKRYLELVKENHPDTLRHKYPHLSKTEFDSLVAEKTKLMKEINTAYEEYMRYLNDHESEAA